MKDRIKFLMIALLVIALCVSVGYSDDATAQQYAALMYQALQQEGFTVTDATKGVLASGGNEVFQLSLTAGNDYAFCLAGDTNIKQAIVGILNSGQEVVGGHDSSTWQYKNICIAKYNPTVSGKHYIAVLLQQATASANYYFIVAYR